MKRKSARLAHILHVLEQIALTKQGEIVRAKSKIAELGAQRRDLEAVVTRATPLLELVIGNAAVRLARLGSQIASAQHVLAVLNQSAVDIGRKQKLVEQRLNSALAQEDADAARRELEELGSRLQTASLRQGR